MNLSIKRVSMAAGLLAIAGAASAFTFTVTETGTNTANGSNTVQTTDFNVTQLLASDIQGASSITGGVLVFDEASIPSNGGTVAVTGTLNFLAGTSDVLDFTFSGTSTSDDAGTQSISGDLTVANASSALFPGLQGFGGNLSAQLFQTNSSLVNNPNEAGTISVSAAAVPEPVSMVALGVGLVGLVSRRRSA